MSTTPIGNSEYLRVWDNTGNNLNPNPSGAIIDNGFIADSVTDSSILNYAINILGQKVNQSLAYGCPQWSSNNAYKVGSAVNSGGNIYVSKVDNNLNNLPASSPTQWKLIPDNELISSTYAPLNSPHLTGVPVAPTASAGTNTTQIATTAFVTNAVKHAMPVGGIIAGALNILADGFLACNGATISRTTYSALFRAIGTTYGAGDGSTTFKLPDFRGAFLRGYGGTSPHQSGNIGTPQSDAIRNITGSFPGGRGSPTSVTTGAFKNNGGSGEHLSRDDLPLLQIGFDASQVVPTASENRPYNYAVYYFIKY